MKLTSGLNIINSKDIDKRLSKKITLANTSDKLIDKKAQKKSVGVPSDPIFFTNGNNQQPFNPDIRYRTDFAYSPLTGINYRNDLMVFAENNEVKKAVGIVANETVVIDTDVNRYPVFPHIEQTLVDKEKKETSEAIQDYLDKIFYPKLYQWYNFKDDGLIKLVKEYLCTGKIAFEIIYDSLTNPKEIIGVQPIDPSTIQKFKYNDLLYYVQRPLVSENGIGERILHENQIVLCEWNEYDFGYISYVDKLRRSFNIMRSMNTAKILWFAAKSQVRMHIKLALGDVSRPEAITKLTTMKNEFCNNFAFEDDGIVRFNGKPNNVGYREFYTAETAASGTPEIEEINSNGPDLTETDSLNYWSKLFWSDTEIPYSRIDQNAGDSWGFTDVNNLRQIEINFSKFINSIRKQLNALFLKPIIIQLTLKEVEIGVDLSLLDTIKMEWIAFNQYDKLAELEVLNKKVELAQNLSQFGEYTDVNGNSRKAVPLLWIMKSYLDFTKEQLDSMEEERVKENLMLGFNADGSTPEGSGEDDAITEEDDGLELDDNGEINFKDSDPEELDTNRDTNRDTSMDTTMDTTIVDMVKSGDIPKDMLPDLIDAGDLTKEEISELKEAGLLDNMEESPEEISSNDDEGFE